jgi:hypothetical protein
VREAAWVRGVPRRGDAPGRGALRAVFASGWLPCEDQAQPRARGPQGGNLEPRRTPDGRYLIVRGRLWRAANPALSEDARERLVRELMRARREVRAALAGGDATRLSAARAAVQAAKVALGERGAPWWTDGAPDYNRHLVGNSPYAAWYAGLAQPRA